MQGKLAILALAASLLLVAATPPPATAARGGLIAPAAVCPDQGDIRDRAAGQLRAMRCLTNFARRQRGLAPLRQRRQLNRAARRKSIDILRCDEFSHEACGRDFTHWFERFGYLRRCSLVGENIAWGSGAAGSVRSLFTAWMRSPGHRANILSRDYEHLGLGLRVGELAGVRGARVWTQAFGGACS